MPTAMTYLQKLRDPRWQKKKNGILIRDDYTCQHCHATDKNLQVHHLAYGKDGPWDVEDLELLTLCEDCHSKVEVALKSIRFAMANQEVASLIYALGSYSERRDLAFCINYVGLKTSLRSLALIADIKCDSNIEGRVAEIADHEAARAEEGAA